ncbi:hypothetical protein L6R52_19230 [Myxococcota bacterium]|nr:hypothetical protein [Myxococcota bacterium]
MANTLSLTSENLRAQETFVRLDEDDVEVVCGTCGAPVEVVRATRSTTGTDVTGRPPVVLVRCSRAERHLFATFTPRAR